MPAAVSFGLNRFDFRSPAQFAADVARAEALGWDWAFIPASSLRLRDPYINLAFAARETSRIGLGVLLDNPVVREPGALASSIATVEELAPGRSLLCLGAGDTAVRLLGRRPARVAELEAATTLTRRLLAGESIDVGADRPAQLGHARPVPVWIAAGGPRTLRMAGRVADGVFIRVGRHPANLAMAIDAVRAGAAEAGRDPGSIRIGLIFHVVLDHDTARARAIARSMAAGYYEYSPMLFEAPGFTWNGPPMEVLKQQVWPDFHHHGDLEASGALVSFLPNEVADAFALHGTLADIRAGIADVLDAFPDTDIVVAHPMPTPPPGGPRPDYMQSVAEEVIAAFR